MIKIIVTASLTEAKPIIDALYLKRLPHHPFNLYGDEQYLLIISGIGVLATATACSYAMALYHEEIMHIYNIGICGCVDEHISLGTPLLINKLYDPYQERDFYPDIILSHPFLERDLSSYAKPVYRWQKEDITTTLVDMEGVGFFTAGASYLGVHQMSLIKIVSDYLLDDNATIDKAFIATLIQENITVLLEFINHYHITTKALLCSDEQQLITQVLQQVKGSVTQKRQLKAYIKYYKIKHGITKLSTQDIEQLFNSDLSFFKIKIK